jgi:hypothetical protein
MRMGIPGAVERREWTKRWVMSWSIVGTAEFYQQETELHGPSSRSAILATKRVAVSAASAASSGDTSDPGPVW